MINKRERKKTRHYKIRQKVSGNGQKPRLTVFKSNKYVWAQLIDDEKGTTLASASDKKIKSGTKVEKAREAGNILAKKAMKKKVKKIVFDRAGYKYHGRVKALAEGAREGGLVF
ncbi:50S ribosomal protein L18 [Candidatus Curtissbacteria bacterium RIFCSPLOWO2_01_FULL_42_26]|uniref:Large ribosomal subunit protein uL18 n=1 Tax=Candidatus Curtissbacteria bacterium RIFCSPLOWO2_01_FULL_42_26 TaxID=1797729 RepID=A0A1F5I326_9BACT|nr:MAG: 50S ribosomal protein L18 [Candidatus Curtissbacteria bacterium RIFCSPLOWO2_01_FULL_42_26]